MIARTLDELLAPVVRKGPAEARELLDLELPVFLARRGLAVDERAGRRFVAAPPEALSPALAHAFVADHLATHVSHPVEELVAAGELLAKAVLELPGVSEAVRAGTAELPRLDRLSRLLRRHAEGERPGRELWERDPSAYAAAMRDWEAARPVAEEELEGPFRIRAVGDEALVVFHERRERLLVPLPTPLLDDARAGDRLDALLGFAAGAWFLLESFAVAAEVPDRFR